MSILPQNLLNFSQCEFCSRASLHSICPPCLKLLPKSPKSCLKCASPLKEEGPCGICLNQSFSYDYLLCAGLYKDELKSIIKGLKYQDELFWLSPLAKLLLNKINELYRYTLRPQAIIPMPLHKKRIKERGFNQALELANHLKRSLNTPVLTNSIERIINTKAQSQLSEKERRQNIKKAFQAELIPYSRLALVDDIVTTGASVNEVCRALKAKNRGLRIDVWCLAKA